VIHKHGCTTSTINAQPPHVHGRIDVDPAESPQLTIAGRSLKVDEMRQLTSILLLLSWMSCYFNCSTERLMAGSAPCTAIEHGDCPVPGDEPTDDSPSCPGNTVVLPESAKAPLTVAGGEPADGAPYGWAGLLWAVAMQGPVEGPAKLSPAWQDNSPAPRDERVHIARPIRGPAA